MLIANKKDQFIQLPSKLKVGVNSFDKEYLEEKVKKIKRKVNTIERSVNEV